MVWPTVQCSSATTSSATTRPGSAVVTVMPRNCGNPSDVSSAIASILVPPPALGILPPAARSSKSVAASGRGGSMNDHAAGEIRHIIDTPAFQSACATLRAEHERTVQDIITLTQVEAPSFQEANRAAAWRDMALAHGLQDVETDAEGNVMGL